MQAIGDDMQAIGDDMQAQGTTRTYTQQSVSERYSAAASEREASLCCPVDYDAKLLEIGGGTLEAHHKNITKDLTRDASVLG